MDTEAAVDIQRLGFSVGLLERNHTELAVAIRHLTAPAVAHEMSGVDDRWHRQEAMREVVSLLHNYLAAAKSLVDHTRRVVRKPYQPSSLQEECDRQIKSRFLDDPLVQFLEDLREMAQHYRLPSIRHTTTIQNEGGRGRMEIRMQLTKDDLSQYSGWCAKSRTYLANSGEGIDILALAEEYHSRVTAFHTWFRSQQDAAHGPWHAMRERLTTHGVASPEAAIVEEVQRRVSDLIKLPRESVQYRDLHAALLPALTVWDSQRLALCQYDPAAWVDHALRAVRGRFRLPEDWSSPGLVDTWFN
jgi:hypothetical protein